MARTFAYKESLRVGMLLTGVSGYIDSYTFAFHDTRFASFQSGNILQLGINLAAGHWHQALLFAVPIFFFFLGAGSNQIIKKVAYDTAAQWEELSIFIEFIGILIVALLELLHAPSLVVLSGLAMFMAIQADTFGRLRGMPYATIMSTGNLKTLGVTTFNGLLNYDAAQFIKARNVGLVILSFFGSAFVSHFLASRIGDATLLGAPLLLLPIWFFIRRDRDFTADFK